MLGCARKEIVIGIKGEGSLGDRGELESIVVPWERSKIERRPRFGPEPVGHGVAPLFFSVSKVPDVVYTIGRID